MQTHVELFFGDGQYTFRLGLRQIVAIEDKCASPIGEVFARLLKGRYNTGDVTFGMPTEGGFKLADCVEVIRQGLIGGASGMVDGEPVIVTPLTANALIDVYIVTRPLQEAWNIAAAVMSALVVGYAPPEAAAVDDPASDDNAKKKAPRARRPRASTGDRSSPVAP